MSMDSLDSVESLHGHCPMMPWLLDGTSYFLITLMLHASAIPQLVYMLLPSPFMVSNKSD